MSGGQVGDARRLIPAHAGKTCSMTSEAAGIEAHPRSRGENPDIPDRFLIVEGSSPLTRGKPCRPRASAMHPRLIPAHAGKTSARSSSVMPPPAHPRSRGENASTMASVLSILGSSPLTRGKPHRRFHRPSRTGLIPAHAGKTNRSTASTLWIRAHPRSRGENELGELNQRNARGSSPLTRGKQSGVTQILDNTGLIPAHAGKTC